MFFDASGFAGCLTRALRLTMSHVDSVGANLNGTARLVKTFRPIRLPPMNYFSLQNQPTAEMDRFASRESHERGERRADACWRPADIVQHQFAGAPFGWVHSAAAS
jgi:hypothetical protein